tara:strand:+ start:420 stop:737 length:318 start_codon:yes stop_codon:yes gene_type:complete
MAKTKEKNEEIIDFTKPEKISDEELNTLQATVRTIDRLTADLGRMESQKYALLKAMDKIQDDIDSMRKEFMEKYGTDNINIQSGEIAYAPENPNSKENGEADKKD